jgi:hypothetical protein
LPASPRQRNLNAFKGERADFLVQTRIKQRPGGQDFGRKDTKPKGFSR